MTVDSSLALYRCPYCTKLSRDREEIKQHIKDTREGAHRDVRPSNMDRPIPELFPTVEEKPFGDWKEAVESEAERWLDGNGESEGTRPEVDYRDIAEETGLPRGYVVYQLRKSGYSPIPRVGLKKQSTSWDDLTDKQQSDLLAWAHFPERTHEELAEMDHSGNTTQSSVSGTIRKHGWMLSHPGVETPVYPTEATDDRGEMKLSNDTEELIDSYKEASEERTSEDEEEEPVDPDPEGRECFQWITEKTRIDVAQSLYLNGYDRMEKIREASIDELEAVPRVGERTAERLKIALSSDESPEEAGTEDSPDEPRGSDGEDQDAALSMMEEREVPTEYVVRADNREECICRSRDDVLAYVDEVVKDMEGEVDLHIRELEVVG